jgi:Beta-propeller domains of methanol dehydrogenase type
LIIIRKQKLLPVISAIAAFSLLILMLFLSSAAGVYAAASSKNQHVYDNAGLLSTSDLENMEEMCTKYSNKDGLDIIILTHNDPNAVAAEKYIEDFNDKMQYLNSVILLVDLSNRDVCLESYGSIQSKITAARGDVIIEKITPYLSNGDYAQAFEEYIQSSDKYMNYVPLHFNPLVQLAAALLIGGIAVAIMAFNAGGKMTTGAATYMDQNHSGLIGRRDDYIRTQITRIRKPQNNGSSGGHGGVSSGGLSHTTSSGKF